MSDAASLLTIEFEAPSLRIQQFCDIYTHAHTYIYWKKVCVESFVAEWTELLVVSYRTKIHSTTRSASISIPRKKSATSLTRTTREKSENVIAAVG